MSAKCYREPFALSQLRWPLYRKFVPAPKRRRVVVIDEEADIAEETAPEPVVKIGWRRAASDEGGHEEGTSDCETLTFDLSRRILSSRRLRYQCHLPDFPSHKARSTC